jgi:hypothetical protein
MKTTKPKNIKLDIYKALTFNQLIVWGLVAAFVLVTIIQQVNTKKLIQQTLSQVLVVDQNGEVLPLKWMQRLNNINIEIKDHLEKFHTYFYNYDAYNVEKSIERALWLGDKSVEQLYLKRRNDGWFNRVKMYGIKQEIEIDPENIKISGSNEPFAFEVTLTLCITQDSRVVKYRFVTSGNIIFVNKNYPLNPHGFLITNFSELNRQELK